MIAPTRSDWHTSRRRASRLSKVLICAFVAMIIATIMMPAASYPQGRPFQLEGLKGGSLTPADFEQGVWIAVVWASWSPHCRNIVQQVDAIASRWGGQAKVIMVDFQEDRGDVEAFLGGGRTKAPVYLDKSGAFSKKYSVTNLPGLVIFKDGTAAFSGKLSRNPDSIISQTLG